MGEAPYEPSDLVELFYQTKFYRGFIISCYLDYCDVLIFVDAYVVVHCDYRDLQVVSKHNRLILKPENISIPD